MKSVKRGLSHNKLAGGIKMTKKIIAVNAGPRKGWNTDTLITEAAKGAESKGAVVEKFDLFGLEKYTGCISCFGCKTEKNKGRCICRDGLTEVLDTLQLKDYSKTDWPWSYFDPEAKNLRHETIFPQECAKAYDMGAALIMNEFE